MHHSDEQLQAWCHRLRASDRQAFEAVFRATHAAMYRYVLRLSHDVSTAQDVTQDVFLDLWRMRGRLDPSQSLEALLYRMARNKTYNRGRNRRTRERKLEVFQQERLVMEPGMERPDVALHESELRARIHRWIDALPDRQREALTLSRYDGLSHKEIADVMDISPRTVNNHIVGALKHLRERLQDSDQEVLSA